MPSIASNPVHITSLVVHAMPAQLESVIQQVESLPEVEVHGSDPVGKFIVLLETDDEQSILTAIDRIQAIDGVLTATMVYHHIDD